MASTDNTDETNMTTEEHDDHTIVLARWKGRKKAGEKRRRAVDSFDVVFCPRKPMQVGKFVHILGVSPTLYWNLAYTNRPRHYDVYDPQVFGPIIAIKAEHESTVEVVVHNLLSHTTVDLAYVTTEKIPGKTILFDETSDRRRWKNKESDGPERPVKIEWDAVATDPDQIKVTYCSHSKHHETISGESEAMDVERRSEVDAGSRGTDGRAGKIEGKH